MKFDLIFRQEQGRSNRNFCGHHPRSQRLRKMRDYDSDTGYRSEQELMKFRHQQQQMFQRNADNYDEIVPVASTKTRRRDGYSSDVEGYTRRAMNVAYHEVNAQDSRSNSSQDGSQSHRSLGNGSSRSPSKQSVAVRNDELYEHNPINPVTHPSSPSPLQSRNITDQSTPLVQSNAQNYGRSGSETEWRKDLFQMSNQMGNMSVMDPENRYMVESYSLL